MSVETVLSRLDKVRSTGRDKWIASCPAHADKSPSLAIKETSDGTVLLHCFAGCQTPGIVHAIGLELSDLFPAQLTDSRAKRPQRNWSASEAIAYVASESLIAAVCAADIAKGESTEQSLATLWRAAGRLAAAHEVING